MALGCRFIHFLLPLPLLHSPTEAHTKAAAQSLLLKYKDSSYYMEKRTPGYSKTNDKNNINTSQLSSLSHEVVLVPILTLLTE